MSDEPLKKKKILVLLGDPLQPDPIKKGGKFNTEDLAVVHLLKVALDTLTDYLEMFIFLDDHQTMLEKLIAWKKSGEVYLVLNLCDEGFNNRPTMDMHIPALLDMLGLPYTGAGAHCMVMSYPKDVVHYIAQQLGIPVPEYLMVNSPEEAVNWPGVYPALVKPNMTHGSFGLSARNLVYNRQDLERAIKETMANLRHAGFDPTVKIEEFLPGYDLTVGIVGNPPNHRVLPMIREDYSALPAGLPHLCGHEAKWDPDSPYWQNLKSVPAVVSDEVREEIARCSVLLFQKLGARDYARFDWRLDQHGRPKFLDANPNCGWVYDGHLNKMAGLAGITYSQLLQMIIKAAVARYGL